MERLSEYLKIPEDHLQRIVLTLAFIAGLSVLRLVANLLIKGRVEDPRRLYSLRRGVLYVYSLLLIIILGRIWIRGLGSLSTFLGLASAGLAVAMHDTIANIAGWVFIISRAPFRIGDRIQIGDTSGDVIDIRLFEFSLVEIGNWVDADQSTGRIVHVPNSKALREPLANYHIGFAYIWNEIPVLVTFESNWRKAKGILDRIAHEHAIRLSEGAREEIRRAAEKYCIHYGALTPIVYTTVKDSGVLLTIRYLVNPRQRRSSQQDMWEATLDAFGAEPDIDLAYPTTRFYQLSESSPGSADSGRMGLRGS